MKLLARRSRSRLAPPLPSLPPLPVETTTRASTVDLIADGEAVEAELVDSLNDDPLPGLDALRTERARLRRIKRPNPEQQTALAHLDGMLGKAIGTGVFSRLRTIEHRELDTYFWRTRLRPYMRELTRPRAGDGARTRALRERVDLPAMRTFLPGFGVWWLTRGWAFHAPGSDEHKVRAAALTGLEAAGFRGEQVGRFLALVHDLRYPVETAFAEWVDEQTRRVRPRGFTQKAQAIARKVKQLGSAVSASYLAQTDAEVRRLRSAAAYLALMRPHVAPVKNPTRRHALVMIVDVLTARKVPIAVASEIVAGLLPGENAAAVRRLFQHSPRRT